MLRVGLTGGLASGKSFVASTLEELGCAVFRADEAGRRVMLRGGPAYEAVIAEFGPDILRPDGEIDRRALAAIVFADQTRLAALNRIIHPLVIAQEEEFFRQQAARNPCGIAVVEAAILIETGSYKRFDKLILTWCRPEQQLERALARSMSREEALARMAAQMPLDEKRRYADFVIDTSGTREHTREQTVAVFEALKGLCR